MTDPMIHCIRAYLRYRIMIGMHCMPMSRLQRLKLEFIQDYEENCVASPLLKAVQGFFSLLVSMCRKYQRNMAKISGFLSNILPAMYMKTS